MLQTILRKNCIFTCVLITLNFSTASGIDISSVPSIDSQTQSPAQVDYLVQTPSAKAGVFRSEDSRELILDNGLIRRTWRVAPNGACVGFDNLMTGASMLRSVRPEARVTIDGVPYDVGGLVGQPNHAFLKPDWLDAMQADPKAMRLVGFEVGQPKERFPWGRVRHAAPTASWPPRGAYLRMDYAMPALEDEHIAALLKDVGKANTPTGQDNQAPRYAPPSGLSRKELLRDEFTQLDGWKIHTSSAHDRTSFENEGKPGEIYTPANTSVYAERGLPAGTRQVEATFDVGTDRSASWGPGIALVFKNRVIKFNIRPIGNQYDGNPLLGLWDGEREHTRLGGRAPLDTSKPWTLRLRMMGETVFCDAKPAGGKWANYGHTPLANAGEPQAVRIGKMDVRGGNTDNPQPGELVRLKVQNFVAYSEVNADGIDAMRSQLADSLRVRVSVHYELYDHLPVISKWVTVHNAGDRAVTLERFTGEELALVEHANWVEAREGATIPRPDYLHVETDFSFGGFNHRNANRHAVHWRTDPLFSTQVNWARRTPCLLVCEPTYGPAQSIPPGDTFEGFRVFELAYDNANRERQGLALRKMYRTLAPWVTENPLTHHLLTNSPERVLAAIDEAKQVGFEAIILSFGSGFNMENRDPRFLETWKKVADHAQEQGIELGCYSLFSSRGVGDEHMIASPQGQRPTHGKCPAVTSAWGQQWLQTIRRFYEQSGFNQFENDGPYPGDVDVTPRPPLQQGEQDSRWVQWRMTAQLYRDLRKAGIYINAPDYYYLNGSNKCGMGYREVNWSLPREHQALHTRQNIYDGTWTKTPSMGWMFVPLSQYHGGGAAATIEPLHEHLDHYQTMMQSNLGLGVQAHYRGPRLFDTPETREMVKASVDWFKKYRTVLESDLIHGRRADGRDLDWMLHVNPRGEHKGMLVVYNPLPGEVTKTLPVNLYYTGLTDTARVSHEAAASKSYELARDYTITLKVTVPPSGMTWYVIE